MPTNLEYLTNAHTNLGWAKAFATPGYFSWSRNFCDMATADINAADAQTAAGAADAEFTSCRTYIGFAKGSFVDAPTSTQLAYGKAFCDLAQRDIADLRALLTPPSVDDYKCVMWANNDSILGMSADTIAQMKAYGVDGYALQLQYMPDLGSNLAIFQQKISTAVAFANANPTLRCYVLCRLAHWASSGGGAPPQFDNDAKWAKVNAGVAMLAQAVEDSALVGIGFDAEGFPPNTPDRWYWPGYGVAEATARQMAEDRGAEVAATIEGIDGTCEVIQYHVFIPGSWREVVQYEVNDIEDAYADHMAPDWVTGITSTGLTYRHCDAVTYKGPHVQYDVDDQSDLTLAQRWDQAYTINNANWDATPYGALSTTYQNPMIWLTNGPKARAQIAAGQTVTAFDRAMTVEDATLSLSKARQYTQGKLIILYHQGAIVPSEWAPYASAIQSASA